LRPPAVATLCTILILAASLSAQTLAGTVKNGTTGKPAGGDEVVLIKLGEGMEEAARTKTDASGLFSFTLGEGGPHLVRAIHQGVTYDGMAPPGTSSVDVTVYDVARKVDALSVTADVMRLQAQGSDLQGIRLFVVSNTSNPPRTQMSDPNFEFFLPEGAQIDDAMAMTEGGQPLKSAPVPQKEKNRYGFIFPLRPGETQFQVGFHLPYSGELAVDPKPLYAAQHFVVMLPETMHFTAAPGTAFQAMQHPRQPDTLVQVASNTQAGQSLAFKVSGTGTLKETGDNAQGGPGGTEAAAGRDSRPGGGLGPPIDAPDPLEKYRWYILGGFALVLAAGAIYITTRSKVTAVADFGPSVPDFTDRAPAAPPVAGRPGLLLEALKEELFQLEVEHKQGSISRAEYEKAKAALDQTLERALKRTARKPRP
jgi:hypothetical protein